MSDDADQVDATLASFVPIDSSFVRGAVTAYRWFAPDTVKTLRVVDSLERALDEAMRALEAQGTPFTGDRAALRRALHLNEGAVPKVQPRMR